MKKPRRQITKRRFHLPQLTEGQWHFGAATLGVIYAAIQFLDNHWK